MDQDSSIFLKDNDPYTIEEIKSPPIENELYFSSEKINAAKIIIPQFMIDSTYSSYSIIESSADDKLFYSRDLLIKQLQKTAIVLGIMFCFVYLMTLEMVFIDNRSLEYVYGVTNPIEWQSFAEAVAKVNVATNDEGPFPIALLRPSFGGVGYQEVLAQFPFEMNISSVYNGGILLPMDVVISTTQNLYIEWRSVADTLAVVLFVISAMFVMAIPYLWRRRVKGNYLSSIVLLRRLLAIVGLNYFFRGCVLGLTILPPGSLACVPKLRYTFWEKIISPIWLIAGTEVCCYDFMYSGHTSLTTVLVWFWVLYLPGVVVNFNQGRIITTICTKVIGALLVFLMISALTISRLHYSIDVALGLFIGSAAFWSWHATLCLYHYSRILDRANLISSFRIIVFCIGWLDGIDEELLPNLHVPMSPSTKHQIYLSDENSYQNNSENS